MAGTVDDFPLLPTDDLEVSADAALDAAVASALEQFPTPAQGTAPVPFGRTPLFDFGTGRFVRRGGVVVGQHGALYPSPSLFPSPTLFPSAGGQDVVLGAAPAMVEGHEALAQWVMMTIHSARFAHAVFTDGFGMELPDSILGEVADIAEKVSDWGQRLREAVLRHDRVTGLENFSATYDEDNGIVYVNNFEVVTDEGDRLSFGPLEVAV